MIDLNKKTYVQHSFQLIDDVLGLDDVNIVSPKRETLTNMYERYALSHYLMYYPEDMGFEDVLKLVRESDERVFAWDVFIECEPYELSHEIEAMRTSLEECFTIREEGI